MYFNIIKNYRNIPKNIDFLYHYIIRNSLKIAAIKYGSGRKQEGIISGRRLLSMTEANDFLYKGLISSEPFMVARSGATEQSYYIVNELIERELLSSWPKEILQAGMINSGIFPPTAEVGFRFAKEYINSFGHADMLAYWGFIILEEYVFKKHSPHSVLFPSRAFEPFGFENPWTIALEGKRVLVIHPFEEAIISQYKRREYLFSNKKILPEFELVTLKAIQSAGGQTCEYNDWFQALDYMYREALKKDFDIVLLGCGAYGLPLAARFKQIGKKAVNLGGMSQLLFGIKGDRWDRLRPDIVNMYNSHWVRISKNEKPANADIMVDGPAYW